VAIYKKVAYFYIEFWKPLFINDLQKVSTVLFIEKA